MGLWTCGGAWLDCRRRPNQPNLPWSSNEILTVLTWQPTTVASDGTMCTLPSEELAVAPQSSYERGKSMAVAAGLVT